MDDEHRQWVADGSGPGVIAVSGRKCSACCWLRDWGDTQAPYFVGTVCICEHSSAAPFEVQASSDACRDFEQADMGDNGISLDLERTPARITINGIDIQRVGELAIAWACGAVECGERKCDITDAEAAVAEKCARFLDKMHTNGYTKEVAAAAFWRQVGVEARAARGGQG